MPFNSTTGSLAGENSSRKSVPNKTTAAVQRYFQDLLTDNLDQLGEDIKSLEPAQRIKILLELARYVIPRLNTVHYVENNPNVAEFNFSQLSTDDLNLLVRIFDKYGFFNNP